MKAHIQKNKNQEKLRSFTKEEFEYFGGRSYEDYLEHYRSNRKFELNSYNICCFHINEEESFALWKIYASSDYSIAIQTTYEQLKKSFEICKDKDIFCGKVEYRDYSEESLDTIDISDETALFLSKRKCFEYENECRAIYYDYSDLNKISKKKNIPFERRHPERDQILGKNHGIYIPVNLNSLISNVYCSPNSPDWFVELVKSIRKKYGYEFSVIRSSIDDEPQF